MRRGMFWWCLFLVTPAKREVCVVQFYFILRQQVKVPDFEKINQGETTPWTKWILILPDQWLPFVHFSLRSMCKRSCCLGVREEREQVSLKINSLKANSLEIYVKTKHCEQWPISQSIEDIFWPGGWGGVCTLWDLVLLFSSAISYADAGTSWQM